MDCSANIRCSGGRAQSTGRSGHKRVECQGGYVTALLSKVTGDTTNLTMLKVVAVPELVWWSWLIIPKLGVK